MDMAKRKKKREYLRLLEKSIDIMHSSIDSFNRVYGEYRVENTLILLTNAWELFGKAILIKKKIPIYRGNKKNDQTIAAEETIRLLLVKDVIDKNQADILQQVISLRHEAIHYLLPEVPEELQHHLLFFSCKFFKDLVEANFSSKSQQVQRNYLSLSFDHMTTYAAKVQKLVSKLRKCNDEQKKLVWLLERGVDYTSRGKYISQNEFEIKYKRHKKILPHLELNDVVNESDMVKVVAVQAPRNFTADINLRKGNHRMKDLPVTIKRSNVDVDFPYLTKDIAEKVGKSINFISRLVSNLKLKDNEKYHQRIRVSDARTVQRYSEAALSKIKELLKKNPEYDPYKSRSSMTC